jgi:hypothetical protein
MAQRIKGQETVIGFTNPDGDQDGIDDILDFEAELDIEILGKVSREDQQRL